MTSCEVPLPQTLMEIPLGRKRNKITVLLDREEYVRFEAYCEDRGFKKSTLIARLIREHLDSLGFRTQRELPLARHEGGEHR